MAKIHKDCPLTKEDIDAIKAELYYVNSTNHCANPPHPSWYRGLNDWQCQQVKHPEAYREWLEKELRNIQVSDQGTCNLQNLQPMTVDALLVEAQRNKKA